MELERHDHFEILETNLSALFQFEEEPKVEKISTDIHSHIQSCEILDHLKSIVADCGLVFV